MNIDRVLDDVLELWDRGWIVPAAGMTEEAARAFRELRKAWVRAKQSEYEPLSTADFFPEQ